MFWAHWTDAEKATTNWQQEKNEIERISFQISSSSDSIALIKSENNYFSYTQYMNEWTIYEIYRARRG